MIMVVDMSVICVAGLDMLMIDLLAGTWVVPPVAIKVVLLLTDKISTQPFHIDLYELSLL